MFDENIKKVKNDMSDNFILVLAFTFIFCIAFVCFSDNPVVEKKHYNLMPVEENKYVIYTPMTDSDGITYEAITVCINNKVYNLTGQVNINYVDVKPTMDYESSTKRYGDKYSIKAPKNTIIFKSQTSIFED